MEVHLAGTADEVAAARDASEAVRAKLHVPSPDDPLEPASATGNTAVRYDVLNRKWLSDLYVVAGASDQVAHQHVTKAQVVATPAAQAENAKWARQ